MIRLLLQMFGGRGGVGSSPVSSVRDEMRYNIFALKNGERSSYKSNVSGKGVKGELRYDSNKNVWKDRNGKEYVVKQSQRNMRTVLVRTPNGKLTTQQYNGSRDTDEYLNYLRKNGFSIKNVWTGKVTAAKIRAWIKKNK